MSGLTKKRLTKKNVEIIVGRERFIGPKTKLRPLLRILEEHDFKPVQDQTSVPWEELAADRIRKFGKPGLALKGARLKEGLTQIQLAKKLSIPQYNLSKMERGSRPIGKNMAKRLSKVLRIDYRVFL